MKKKEQLKENLVGGILDKYGINITPDKSLFYKMGESGHNFYESVAELIDNSIDAKTPAQHNGTDVLNINIIINVKKRFFSISDNGTGMDKLTAIKAATLGKSSKNAQNLGSFGLGLKSGLMTISNNFVVNTAVEGNNYRTEFEYNDKDWVKSDEWSLPAKDISKNLDEHGTTITVNKVTKIQLSGNKTQYLKNDIAKRYRSFIQSGTVKITVNSVDITVEEVNWSEGYPIDFKIPTQFGEIYGKIGLMTESSQKGYYGFDMFRNGRMIVSNSKFAIGQHPTVARIYGEIHLDFVSVSHEKNKFIVESNEYDVAQEACKESKVFKNILKEAKKKSEDGDNKKENQAFNTEIHTDIPLLAKVLKTYEYDNLMNPGKTMGIHKSKSGLINGILEKFSGTKRKEYEKRDEPKSDYGKENETGNVRGDLIEINGLSFNLKVDFICDKNMGRKSYEYDEANKVLLITINKASNVFKSTKDKNMYIREAYMDAIVSFLYKDHEIILDKFNATKDNLIEGTLKLREMLKTNVNEHELTEHE